MIKEALKSYYENDFDIYDCHTHIGPYGAFNIPKNDKNALIEMMDLINVSKIATSAHLGITSDFIEGNSIVLDAANSFENRIFGYACVNPNYHDNITELDRMFSYRNTIGIKIHGALHDTAINDEKYSNVYEYANDLKTIVLVHTWGIKDIQDILQVAKKYSCAKFIIGHCGAEKEAMKMALKIANEFKNIYVDTALSMAYEGNIEYFVQTTNVEKILYGSDMPFYDPRMTLGRILTSDISYECKKLILGYNFKKITGGEML